MAFDIILRNPGFVFDISLADLAIYIEKIELDSLIEDEIELDSLLCPGTDYVPFLDVGTPAFYEMPSFDLNADWRIEFDIYLKPQGAGDQVVPFGFGNYNDGANWSYLFFEFTTHEIYGRRIDIQFATYQHTESMIESPAYISAWNSDEWHHVLMQRIGNRITVQVVRADGYVTEIYADIPIGETFYNINSYTMPCYRSLYYWGDGYEYDYCMAGTKIVNLDGEWKFGTCYEDLAMTDEAEVNDKIMAMQNIGQAGGNILVGYNDVLYAATLEYKNPLGVIELDSIIQSEITLDSELR